MPATISVVIPAFNASRYVDVCLDSVFCQSGDFDLEVIVVDDGSTDDTVFLLEQRAGVRLHRQAQRGPSAARNVGIAMASGEYVAFLDVDDLWPPGSLKSRFAVMLQNPDAGLAFGDCRQFDE
ncbi:MAG: glycosyltransferase family 2 protein, partial [Chloroflexi bacterium]|nr:glycosyltransferase family 2 protein [Chloroflexota bacterium]